MTIEPTASRGMSVAELLTVTRERRGMTRTAATRELDTTELTYRQWTRGQVPGVEWADAIAAHCGVSRFVVLAAMGILSDDEAATLDAAYPPAIPGYRGSSVDNVVSLTG